MGGTPFIVFGDDWGRNVSTLQHLFRRVVGEHPVLWINSINHRLPRISWYDARRAVEKVVAMARRPEEPAHDAGSAPVAVLTPRVLPWHHVGVVRALNRRSLVHDVRRAVERHFAGERPVLVTGTPVIGDVVRELDALARIYFCMDDYAELPGVDRALLAPLERAFVSEVDTVIATAQHLVDTRRPPSGRAFHLPQGVNHAHFSRRREIPGDLARLPRPRIGFAGGVSDGCDQEILLRLADAVPEGSIVLVGPVTTDVARLARPNIHLLGHRSYDELPAYVQHFDVGIINYVLNDWMRAVDPLKLLEYLSAGIPVVTTDLPEVHKYADQVRIARGTGEFVAQCLDAVRMRTASADAVRSAFAAGHTWESRAHTMLGWVAETCAAAGRGPFRRGPSASRPER